MRPDPSSLPGRRAALTLALLVAAASPRPAGAQTVVHDNGPPDFVETFEMTRFRVADDFTLATPTTLTAMRFWDADVRGAYQGSLTWQIFADAGGTPGAALFTGTVAPARTALGPSPNPAFTRYQNDFALGPLALPAGTYWVGLHNGPLSTTDFLNFHWLTTTTSPTLPTVTDDLTTGAADWGASPGGYHAAFVLYGTTAVPEPGTWALLGSGLLIVGGIAARRGRAR